MAISLMLASNEATAIQLNPAELDADEPALFSQTKTSIAAAGIPAALDFIKTFDDDGDKSLSYDEIKAFAKRCYTTRDWLTMEVILNC